MKTLAYLIVDADVKDIEVLATSIFFVIGMVYYYTNNDESSD